MPLLAIVRDERIALLGLGVACVGTLLMMRSVSAMFRDHVEIHPPEPKTHFITQDTEDSLSIETLSHISFHYDYAVRTAARRILFDRAGTDPDVLEQVAWGL